MLDKERVLIKIDELKGYLRELDHVLPAHFHEYEKIEKKRSCERILQLSIECILDICKILVSGLKLGVPSEENDLFEKILKYGIIDKDMVDTLKKIRGFRNILIHEYADVDDETVYNSARNDRGDFERFIGIILKFINK